jgi:hypothetical protein
MVKHHACKFSVSHEVKALTTCTADTLARANICFGAACHQKAPCVPPVPECPVLYSLEGVSVVRLLHRLQDALVDAEHDGAAEDQQRCVGHNADQREDGQGQQDEQNAAEDQSGLLRVPPVHQLAD